MHQKNLKSNTCEFSLCTDIVHDVNAKNIFTLAVCKQFLLLCVYIWTVSLPFLHPSVLLPFSAFFSAPPLLSSSPLCPCWIGGVNTGREQALFHHARAEPGRSCSAAAPGSKVYCGFHFTFPQPITAPHCSAWTLTLPKNSTQRMGWRQFHNFGPSHLPPPSFSFLSNGQSHVLTKHSYIGEQKKGAEDRKEKENMVNTRAIETSDFKSREINVLKKLKKGRGRFKAQQ